MTAKVMALRLRPLDRNAPELDAPVAADISAGLDLDAGRTRR